MPLQSLVLTSDQSILRQLRSVLDDLGIGVEICGRPEQATECLSRRHFDVGILDCDAAGAGDVIRHLRTAGSSRGAPLFLIGPADRASEAAFTGPGDHLLSRPLALENTWRTLRRARPQMEFAMLRYFRARVEAEALLLRSDGRSVPVRTRDVGVGGVGLCLPLPLQCGEAMGLRLELHGCREIIETQVGVVWINERCEAGLRFIELDADSRSALQAWVAKELHDRRFAFVFNGMRQMPRPVLIPATEPAS